MSRRLIVMAVILGLFLVAPAVGASHGNDTYTASLKARNEPGDVDSNAAGNAIVKLRDGELSYKLIVANIDDVTMAHIHCLPSGSIGVWLFGKTEDAASPNGILAQGEVVAEPGNACGWTTDADVVAAIEDGDAYVNVHTELNPGGEIRGPLG